MSRLKYNLKILKDLEEFFIKNPEVRFGQALWYFGILSYISEDKIRDPFYDEPKGIYEGLKHKPIKV